MFASTLAPALVFAAPTALRLQGTRRSTFSSAASASASSASGGTTTRLTAIHGRAVAVGGRLPAFLSSAARVCRRRVALVVTAAAAASGASSSGSDDDPKFPAPVSPGSPQGSMLAHVLSSEPHLFTAAVEATLDMLSDQIDAEEGGGAIDTGVSNTTVKVDDVKKKKGGGGGGADEQAAGLVLFKRIRDMRAAERRNGVQDLMYASIIQKFLSVGVDMMPPLDDDRISLRGVDLNQLTNGVHSVEALEMVKEHLLALTGPQALTAASNALVRMSKLQAAQMYAASIMFGYFIRKADKRFSLDRAMGTLPLNPLESAKALERLFNSASAMDSVDEADMSVPGMGMGGFGGGGGAGSWDVDGDGNASAAGGAATAAGGAGAAAQPLSTLKQYIKSFDTRALTETARIVSMEGVVLAERQTGALFGSIEELAQEMQAALQEGGTAITSAEELMSRVQEVVGSGKVKTLTVPYATQRRIVLEAVAFGSFLRDVESYVDGYDGRLLTPTSSSSGGGSGGGGGGGEPRGLIGGGPAKK